MSMSNFMVCYVQLGIVMAATDPSHQSVETMSDRDDSGAGIAHLTVVPTNFDPDAPGGRRE